MQSYTYVEELRAVSVNRESKPSTTVSGVGAIFSRSELRFGTLRPVKNRKCIIAAI
jgi:hypothetical protein